jgi:tetratricopeptide (TPR) repeat protein
MKPGLLGVLHKKSVLRAVVLVAILCIVFLGFAIKRQLNLNSQKDKANQLAQQQRRKLQKNASAAQKYYNQQIKETKDPRLQAQYHADIAQNYEDMQEWDKAISELKQSVTIYDKGYSYYAEMASDYANFSGQLYCSGFMYGVTVFPSAKGQCFIRYISGRYRYEPSRSWP